MTYTYPALQWIAEPNAWPLVNCLDRLTAHILDLTGLFSVSAQQQPAAAASARPQNIRIHLTEQRRDDETRTGKKTFFEEPRGTDLRRKRRKEGGGVYTAWLGEDKISSGDATVTVSASDFWTAASP